MPDKARALFHGTRDANGAPLAWLAAEPGSAAVENSDGTIVREAIPETPAVPPHHLSDEEFEALTPRNKERVRDARNDDGTPMYEVRTKREVSESASTTSKTEAAPTTGEGK